MSPNPDDKDEMVWAREKKWTRKHVTNALQHQRQKEQRQTTTKNVDIDKMRGIWELVVQLR